MATDSIEEGRWQCDLFNCYYLNYFLISLLANILNFWQLAWRTCCTLFLGKALKSTAYNAAEMVVFKIKIRLELTKKERKNKMGSKDLAMSMMKVALLAEIAEDWERDRGRATNLRLISQAYFDLTTGMPLQPSYNVNPLCAEYKTQNIFGSKATYQQMAPAFIDGCSIQVTFMFFAC